jgi:hypothetical protein
MQICRDSFFCICQKNLFYTSKLLEKIEKENYFIPAERMLLLELGVLIVFAQSSAQHEVIEVVDVATAEKAFYTSDIIKSHDFKYLSNPGVGACHVGKTPFVLVYVHSKPDNLKRRQMIRETWAKKILFDDMRLVFMIGKVDDVRTSDLLKLEYNSYNVSDCSTIGVRR